MARKDKKVSNTAVKVGITGAVVLGAVVSGFLVSRQGRRFVKDVWQGRSRTPLEDKALDAIWADRKIGRRNIDVQEVEAGVLAISGGVRSSEERRIALSILARITGVEEIEDRLELLRKSSR
jgi:hypothetical protein